MINGTLGSSVQAIYTAAPAGVQYAIQCVTDAQIHVCLYINREFTDYTTGFKYMKMISRPDNRKGWG